MIELCREGDLSALTAFTTENLCLIQISACDFAAWKEAVRGGHKEVCLFLMKTFQQELSNQIHQSLTYACQTNDIKVVAMLLDRGFSISSYVLMFALQTAGGNGNEELIDCILNDARLAAPAFKHTYAVAAICGVFRSGKPELLAKLFPKATVETNPAATEALYCGLMVRAARIGDPDMFLETLKCIGPNCKFSHDPKVNQVYNEFNHIFGISNCTGAFSKVVELCCTNPSSLLIDAVIKIYGAQMHVGDEYRVHLTHACVNGHTNAVKLFTDKHSFSNIPHLIKTARANNQAAVLALFYFKCGQESVFSAEPEHNDSINQLLHEHFSWLAGQFVPNAVTPGNP